jgi:hypothetical protein
MFPTCSIHPNLKLEKHGDKWFAFEKCDTGMWIILKIKDQARHLCADTTGELLDLLAENQDKLDTCTLLDVSNNEARLI